MESQEKKDNFRVCELIGEKEAAELLKLSVKTLRKWRSLGIGIKYVKMGRSIRYRLIDIESFLNASTVDL